MKRHRLRDGSPAPSPSAGRRLCVSSWSRRARLIAVALLVVGLGGLAAAATALSASGDITTFAGMGDDGFSGDGGAATSAALQ